MKRSLLIILFLFIASPVLAANTYTFIEENTTYANKEIGQHSPYMADNGGADCYLVIENDIKVYLHSNAGGSCKGAPQNIQDNCGGACFQQFPILDFVAPPSNTSPQIQATTTIIGSSIKDNLMSFFSNINNLLFFLLPAIFIYLVILTRKYFKRFLR